MTISSSQLPVTAADSAGLDYSSQRELLAGADVKARLLLAQSQDTMPEILYYLAGDQEAEVRQAVAANPATPVQADELLVDDADDDVRGDLALKIARLLPDMPDDEQEKVRELTFDMLKRLASDQLPRVRALLSEELKNSRDVPVPIIRQLALDVVAIVATPVLEYSPLLSDADLMEVIAAGCADEALCAIARRSDVSEDVSDAVVATLDVPAVATLLANKKASVREATLDQIAENAAEVQSWHEPLAMRPELSIRAVRRVAGFVASSLLETLAARNDLDKETTRFLTKRLKDRIAESEGEVQAEEREQAMVLDQRSLLDDEAMEEAIQAGRNDFVLEALALRSEMDAKVVARIMASSSAMTITALAWKANLSMRTAIQLQSRTGRIPPKKLLNARHGTDYPETGDEMLRHLKKMI
ncbi:MAG: DUF2336 domain-containing protein [Rhodospirillaceae bacterium]|nr:DUF2336 domain-containing protein [Rhodospirillaceae bacterium]MBT5079509.1 DUF2336 domain-containing protein [Rhodospirillaceae bacterium]